ncbi:hypothetical protein ABEV13_14705 [Geobacillus stearothermophilus]|uniref:hypothetical protein n=1 Tax=Geobacillus TaxID=129337 RepID=UPI002E22E647|nr:hypothetical protein [Geobacillus stearothermophilus]MED3748288.1 hypothetical protein [Geobacillus stearothermophilus]MED3754705.1 hypothetical protein [Geobacillus stearothermophilus]MED3770601.1 hypothetical protein [Geobacillus stearothermophilus]MED3773281.1 hypothetical protein [Geobacillus stearothermophilus]
MPTISVKTSFQQKTNSYTPMIAAPKPSSPVATSVSHSTSNTTISKDVVIISDAAKKAYVMYIIALVNLSNLSEVQRNLKNLLTET